MNNHSTTTHGTTYTTDMLDCLTLIHQGKVRDSFALDENHMLIVASDRLSAFDVVLPDPVPGKGALLTKVSNFWFEKTRHIIDNHLTGIPVGNVIADPQLAALLEDRAVIVRRLQPLPVEFVLAVPNWVYGEHAFLTEPASYALSIAVLTAHLPKHVK